MNNNDTQSRLLAEQFVAANLAGLCRELSMLHETGLLGTGLARQLCVMCSFAGSSAQAMAIGMIQIAAVREVAGGVVAADIARESIRDAEIARLIAEIRAAKSMAWRDGLFERIIEVFEAPAAPFSVKSSAKGAIETGALPEALLVRATLEAAAKSCEALAVSELRADMAAIHADDWSGQQEIDLDSEDPALNTLHPRTLLENAAGAQAFVLMTCAKNIRDLEASLIPDDE